MSDTSCTNEILNRNEFGISNEFNEFGISIESNEFGISNIVTNPAFLQTGCYPGLLYLIVVYLWLFIELADYCCDCATEGYNVSTIYSYDRHYFLAKAFL